MESEFVSNAKVVNNGVEKGILPCAPKIISFRDKLSAVESFNMTKRLAVSLRLARDKKLEACENLKDGVYKN